MEYFVEGLNPIKRPRHDIPILTTNSTPWGRKISIGQVSFLEVNDRLRKIFYDPGLNYSNVLIRLDEKLN